MISKVKQRVFIIYMKLHKLEIIYDFDCLECCEFVLHLRLPFALSLSNPRRAYTRALLHRCDSMQ